ncbi:NADP-dependent oxidoreductase [Chengkuizengella axinellae]|uniref:NADP-dependent oxidoreductase n=1 Tax=Chengkuizengella axinellae TaxID=3064388 RepID=A0ABT9IUG2_9BACL|nr:NADP-dependent oxidoreductase [Chengkuizengella sp. 2205SS18-9]MDP5272923.1 NADP-dependent oxidoreductase [Chengkuizengella sp. 2205SS18-9]
MKNEEIQLASRPEGLPDEHTFRFVSTEMPAPKENEILVKSLYLSVDPYMRGRMREGKSYAAPYSIDQVITGGVVGEVVESKSSNFQKGDIVTGMLNWARYQTVQEGIVQKVNPSLAPISTNLGVLGMPGATAYFGLMDIGQPKEGETVVVSGAAGAVGMLVGQIAKIQGARVVGIAGSQEKIDYLVNELNFDVAINYKDADFKSKLADACSNGVDVYFENVGGEISDEVFKHLNTHARIPVCGAISSYNNKELDLGPRVQTILIKNRALMKGFLVSDYANRFPEGIKQLAAWIMAGKLKYEETIIDGFENTPEAFLGLFKGTNLGKLLVKVADPSQSS